MRDVKVADAVWGKLAELRAYLTLELKLSEDAAMRRSDRIGKFLKELGAPTDYQLCRFKRWRILEYRCAVFEKDWIFAYEVFDEGIIVRDMCHAKLLKE